MQGQFRCLIMAACLSLPFVHTYAENLALGASYTFSVRPNYAHCSDAGDTTQLSDGQYVTGYFWTQQGAVGWSGAGQVIITIDLGEDKPIAGVSFSTAAGVAGVEWPTAIAVFTAGEDGDFHDAGDLVTLSARKTTPPANGYATHRYTTDALRTHGRKIALVVFGAPYIFCDEIEVWKGEEAWLAEPLSGEGVTDLRAHTARLLTHNGVKRRIMADIAAVRNALETVDEREKPAIDAVLDTAAAELDALPAEYGPDFKTMFPINATHKKVFGALAAIWRMRGLREPIVWAACPWYPMESCPAAPGPAGAGAQRLRLDMMQHETRSVAFNIATAEEEEIAVSIAGVPDGLQTPCILARSVAWTDTRTGEPSAAALLSLEGLGYSYRLRLTPGLLQQVWLTVNSKELKPGIHELMLRVNGQRLPFTIQVYPLRFPDRPTLHMGGWDYTNVLHHYEVTEANRDALTGLLRECYVDSPWAVSSALPFGGHDAAGVMTVPPDTSNFDAWRRLWPNARRYCVFAAVGNKCKQWPMGTEAFNQAVGDWARFWGEYMRGAGLEPSQLLVLLVDEPHNAEMDAVITHWAKAIHASGAGIQVWEDPTYRDMAEATPEMIAQCDVLCPNRQLFYAGGKGYRAFFAEQRAKGKTLEFYSCSGPMRLLDPYTYCRLQAWDCWRYGAVATHFWAFADGAGGSSWNEYPQPRNAYTPLFIDDKTVAAGKHMEAMREGVADYEYLVMLDRAIQDKKGSESAREHAAALLRELPEYVCAVMPDSGLARWRPPSVPIRAELARLEILRALMRLQDHPGDL